MDQIELLEMEDNIDEHDEILENLSEKEIELIKSYPKSMKKINVNVCEFGITTAQSEVEISPQKNGQSIHISPHGFEIKTAEPLKEGSLVKIHLNLPNYWSRKQQYIDYGRIDTPDHLKVLGKVIATKDATKRGKKKLITIKTVIIDEVDEKILKSFIEEG